MKWSNEIEKHFKSLINEAVDQDKDGDNDFDDIKIARMMASGMSKEDALKKVKEEKELDESIEEGELKEANLRKFSTDELKRIIKQAEGERVSPAFAMQVKAAHAELKKRGETMKEEEELDEMNSTASAGGEYMTPYAFGKADDDVVEPAGMKKVKKTNKIFKPMESKSTYKKMMAEMYGVVNKGSYFYSTTKSQQRYYGSK